MRLSEFRVRPSEGEWGDEFWASLSVKCSSETNEFGIRFFGGQIFALIRALLNIIRRQLSNLPLEPETYFVVLFHDQKDAICMLQHILLEEPRAIFTVC
jgi:hypothetical protein